VKTADPTLAIAGIIDPVELTPDQLRGIEQRYRKGSLDTDDVRLLIQGIKFVLSYDYETTKVLAIRVDEAAALNDRLKAKNVGLAETNVRMQRELAVLKDTCDRLKRTATAEQAAALMGILETF
jgi:hypothetical protein